MGFGLVLSTKEHFIQCDLLLTAATNICLVAYRFHCLIDKLYFMITLNSVVVKLEVRLTV